jgi:hypothetical protein
LHKESRLNRIKAPSSKRVELSGPLLLDLTAGELLQPRHDLQGSTRCKTLSWVSGHGFLQQPGEYEEGPPSKVRLFAAWHLRYAPVPNSLEPHLRPERTWYNPSQLVPPLRSGTNWHLRVAERLAFAR